MSQFLLGDNLFEVGKINPNSIDLVITSPPYFNVKDYVNYKDLDNYLLVMKQTFSKVFEILKESRMCVVNISPIIIPRKNRNHQSKRIPLPFYFVPLMEEIGFEFLEDIIWKNQMVLLQIEMVDFTDIVNHLHINQI